MANGKPNIDNGELEGLLSVIFKTYGYDFSNYARASLTRRVAKFIADLHLESLQQLKYKIVNDKEVFNYFLQRVTVNVTEMFRDPDFYRSINEQVIPRLASYPIIKIWHAGCSTGEEVFSLCILLQEAGLLNRTRIYATDINPLNLERARQAIIPLALMKEYTTNYQKAGGKSEFSNYYTAKYDNAIIAKDLRKNILFSQHSLVTDEVFNEFQLICCRNVLIYFNQQLQNRVVKLFHDSLSSFGYLALGVKESLLFTDLQSNFEAVNKSQKIFRRRI